MVIILFLILNVFILIYTYIYYFKQLSAVQNVKDNDTNNDTNNDGIENINRNIVIISWIGISFILSLILTSIVIDNHINKYNDIFDVIVILLTFCSSYASWDYFTRINYINERDNISIVIWLILLLVMIKTVLK